MAKRRGWDNQDEEKKPLNKSNLKKLAGIFRYTFPYKTPFLIGMVCLAISSVTVMAFPFLAGKLLDVAKGKSSWPFTDINSIVVMMLGILVLQSIFSFFRVYLFAQVSEKSMADVRLAVYSKLISLPFQFFDNRRVGELTSRITADVTMLQSTFSITLAEFFRQILVLIMGTAIILAIAFKLTLFMLAVFPALVISALFFGKFIRKFSKKSQDELAKANVIVEETFQSINVVKAFTNEFLEISRYKSALHDSVKTAIKSATYRGGFIVFIIMAIFGGIVAVMWYGSSLVASDELDIGVFVTFVLITVFIGGAIGGLGDIISQVQRSIGASERVLEILNENAEELSGEANLNLNGDIEFRNVGFAYPSRKDIDVLTDINLNISKGQKIALVGPSGAGKSTIIQLLMRFYELDKGKILVDNNEISTYDLQSYRSNIGVVPQEVILFGGTIKENIAYGNPDASVEEIRMAAEKANALEFIDQFPEGFETIVGERGVKLSGGQRQRIAIARAILKDPSILILDEATSSLDAESESLVQKALDTLMVGRTTIIIAHRLATIRKVDRIFVLKEGKLVESGSHIELSKVDNGIYSNLIKLQFELN
ncbi:MAG: ABC transporter transmembrane domain-containing protein [Bacteroidota bacterium]